MDDGIRVLVVGDRDMLSEALSLCAHSASGLAMVDPTETVEQAIRLCRRESIDVVLVDIDRPSHAGVEAVHQIHSECPQVRIIALSAFGGTELIASSIIAGACGYAPTSSGIDQLIRAIRRAAAGEMVMPATDLPTVLDELRGTRVRASAEARSSQRLTGRERQILRGLAAGQGIGEIAEMLGISPLTVQSHVKNILAKLGVHSKVEAVWLAWREGLVPVPQSA